MNKDIAIQVTNLEKIYSIGSENQFKSFFPFLRSNRKNNPTFKALSEVNFEVKKGEVLGIIGKNGAGKSTLLKILSQITTPSKGKIEINGRMASLLEVGTGFHQELTGRENIYLNGTILGMSRQEVNEKLNEIIAFSGVNEFIDTPVKHYSSGMYVRLAFAVAAHLEPEILIIDEVLAVGDIEFQKKCIGKMKEVAGDGRTVIFVSHDINAIRTLCDRCLLIDQGEIISEGETNDVIDKYLGVQYSDANQWFNKEKNKDIYIQDVCISLAKEQPTITLLIDFTIHSKSEMKDSFFSVDINNGLGYCIAQCIPDFGKKFKIENGLKKYSVEVELENFIPDRYSISTWIGPHYTETYDWNENILQFEIIDSPQKGRTFVHTRDHGFITPKGKYLSEKN